MKIHKPPNQTPPNPTLPSSSSLLLFFSPLLFLFQTIQKTTLDAPFLLSSFYFSFFFSSSSCSLIVIIPKQLFLVGSVLPLFPCGLLLFSILAPPSSLLTDNPRFTAKIISSTISYDCCPLIGFHYTIMAPPKTEETVRSTAPWL